MTSVIVTERTVLDLRFICSLKSSLAESFRNFAIYYIIDIIILSFQWSV